MELTHSFTVPASRAQTWAAFEDIESVAGCFPGATVTEVTGDDFKGTCKVKLGPIALVYSGTGTFLSKDEAAGTFLIEAKGKDKRGNGTAGAKVVATLTEAGPSATDVSVVTDLAITGKPAQFGRGVMQDVSDKLLQQFVTCLQSKVGGAAEAGDAAVLAASGSAGAAGASGGGDAAGVPSGGAGQPTSLPDEAEQAAVAVAGHTPTGSSGPGSPGTPSSPSSAGSVGPSASAPSGDAAAVTARSEISPVRSTPPGSDDALDLGATVLPVLARAYGRQVGIGAGLLLVGYLLGRRARG